MKKVLVVDDDALMRFSLSAMLRTEQVEVTAVDTGGAALKEIERTNYDACFLDLHLPDISGRDVLQVIRASSPSTRTAIMTGGEVSDELMAIIRRHAQLFLEKPFDMREAKAFVEQGGDGLQEVSRDRGRTEGAGVCGRRGCERTPAARTIGYAVLSDGSPRRERERPATVIDVSDTGMCIRTTNSLQPGQCIEISSGADVRRGTVRWSRVVGSGKEYRAGIQYA